MTKRNARGDDWGRRGSAAVAVAGLAALIGAGVGAAEAPCAPPGWLKVVDVRIEAGELTGSGRGPTPEIAGRQARRVIAQKLMAQHRAELMALPSVKPVLNHKSYTDDELAKALTLAVAFNIVGPKRLNSDVVCDISYVALAANAQAVLAALRAEPELGEQMNLALTGRVGRLDRIEDDRVTAAEQRQVDGLALARAKGAARPEATLRRLRQGVAALDDADLLEAPLRAALLRKTDRLAAAVRAVAGADQLERIAKAAGDAAELARGAEKLLAATRAVQEKDYVAAYEMLVALGSAGDDAAQFDVGYMLSQALGTKRDYREALGWLRRAAAQNNGPAKMLIGILLLSGHGEREGAAGALRWIDSAAADGWTCEAEMTMCRKR